MKSLLPVRFSIFIVVCIESYFASTEVEFAIAFAVALCFGLNPSKLIFEQNKMRDHLLHCLKENEFTNFPFSINPIWKKKKIVINKETLFVFVEGSTTVRWQNAFPVMNGFILGA